MNTIQSLTRRDLLRAGGGLAAGLALAGTPLGRVGGVRAGAFAPATTADFVANTFTVAEPFATYYQMHGGQAQCGYPLTNRFPERSRINTTTYPVQYFERSVMELHREFAGTENEVLLQLLGREQYEARYPQGAPNQQPNNSAGSIAFTETGKRVGGRFLAYWAANGGLRQQGLPLSDEFTEINPTDQNPYLTQYFERARFEYHPENAPPYDVLLGQLGREALAQRYGDLPPAGLPLLPGGTITFAPPRPFNPNAGSYPSRAELAAALRLLYSEGWRGIVTYSMDYGLEFIPMLAREVGFTSVTAGLFWYDQGQLDRERAAALRQREYVDAYCLGNEGLEFQRYKRTHLEQEMARLASETGRPVVTSEPLSQYQRDPTILQLGAYAFPNVHPWWANIREVGPAVEYVRRAYEDLQKKAPGRTIVVKEAWWPAGGGHPAATEANQAEFFRQLALIPVRTIAGEAFDMYWKREAGSGYDPGPRWGLHTDTMAPKAAIAALQRVSDQ